MNDYLSILDILTGLFWLMIITVIGLAIRNKHQNEPHYKYFLPNIFFKIFFALGFAIYYAVIGGGDTTAYFDSTLSLNSLFVKSPALYFDQMTNDPNLANYWRFFDTSTGYPPGWIYREKEAFFVCKILSPIVAIAMRSYLATTIIIAFLISQITWKVFLLVRKLKVTKERYAAIAILFIPSVNFWCAGISKDSVIYAGICYIVYVGFSRLNKLPLKPIDYFLCFLLMWMSYHTRSFVLFITLIPFSLAWASRLLKRRGAKNSVIVGLRTVVLLIGFSAVVFNLSSVSEDELLNSNEVLQQASITQNDFNENDIYTGKRYEIGTIEFTVFGLLRISPAAIFAGTYRPLIYEALSPGLILNGLESILLIFATIRFIGRKPLAKYNYIRKHDFLFFCLVFVLLMAFITGLTSVLFGVLVRLRAPILPLLAILLLTDYGRVIRLKQKISEKRRNQPVTETEIIPKF